MLDEEKFKKVLKSKSTDRNKAINLHLTPNGDDLAVAGVVYLNKQVNLLIQVTYN